MAIRSGFFNSVNGDRKYDAKRFAEYFASFIGNGVFPNPSTNLQVMANNDMTITVKPGKAWINGYILINDDDYILEIEPADGVLNRIDRIVARYDVADREIRLEVKKGQFASSPVAPDLQRDSDAYELGLAEIRVDKGIVSITQANITDLRLSSEYCGIVHGLIDQVDTEVLFKDYQSWINQKKNEFNSDLIEYTALKKQELDTWYDITTEEFEENFKTWFETIQNILDENVAGNLLNMINSLNDELVLFESSKAQPNGLATLDETGNVPVEQLENVLELKDFYGRDVKRIDFTTFDQYMLVKNGVEFPSLIELSKKIYSDITTNNYINYTSAGKGNKIQGVDLYPYYVGYSGMLALYQITSTARPYIFMMSTSISYTSDNVLVVASDNPYDLTNIDYIEYSYYANLSSGATIRIGIQKVVNNQSGDFDKFIPITVSGGSNNNLITIRLDVREFIGEYYLKFSINKPGNSPQTDFYLYDFKFIRETKPHKFRLLSWDEPKIILQEDVLSAELYNEFEISSGFLDWYNLSALVDTPPNTSVRFDIYDKYDRLLKADVKQGEILKLTEPIIKVKTTLSRDSLETPSPVFHWLELGMRGAGDSTLLFGRDVKRYEADEIDIYNDYPRIPNTTILTERGETFVTYGINKPIGDSGFVLKYASGSTTLYDNYKKTIRLFTSSTGSLNVVSDTAYDLTDIDFIEFYSCTTGSPNIGRFGVQKVLTDDTNNFDAYVDVVNNNSEILSKHILDVRNLDGEYYIKVVLQHTSSSSLLFNNISFIHIPKISFKDGKISLHSSILEQEISLPPITIPSRFSEWYGLNALVDEPPGTKVRFDIYDKYGNLLLDNVKNGEKFKNFAYPEIYPRVTLIRDSLETPSPTFSWLEISWLGSASGGVWSKIGEITLDTNASQIDIEIPEWYEEIRIVGSNLGTTYSPSATISLKLNDDSTTSYSYIYNDNTTLKNTSSSSFFFLTTVNSPASGYLTRSFDCLIINNVNGGYKNIRSFGTASFASGSWNNTDKISKITILVNQASHSFTTGSTFEVWGR